MRKILVIVGGCLVLAGLAVAQKVIFGSVSWGGSTGLLLDAGYPAMASDPFPVVYSGQAIACTLQTVPPTNANAALNVQVSLTPADQASWITLFSTAQVIVSLDGGEGSAGFSASANSYPWARVIMTSNSSDGGVLSCSYNLRGE